MSERSRIGRTGGVIIILAAAILATGAARGEQLVTFTRGQAIVVHSVERRGAWYYFTLDRGGEMGVPVNRVASIEEYEAPPAAPAAAVQQVAGPVGAPVPGAPVPTTTQAASAGVPPESTVPGQPAVPDPAASNGTNVASPGTEDWRYKVRMSGGPRRKEGMMPNGPGGPGARGPMGGRMPPGQRRFPPQPPNPQN